MILFERKMQRLRPRFRFSQRLQGLPLARRDLPPKRSGPPQTIRDRLGRRHHILAGLSRPQTNLEPAAVAQPRALIREKSGEQTFLALFFLRRPFPDGPHAETVLKISSVPAHSPTPFPSNASSP